MNHTKTLHTLESLQTLGQVLRWNLAQSPRAEFVNVVVQDEYTHDVIVRVSEHLYAVFAATCLGAVLSVALWDHEPTADELLTRRLERGWKPTPTATRDGKVVLGYASRAINSRA
jgi:hypothetical protein